MGLAWWCCINSKRLWAVGRTLLVSVVSSDELGFECFGCKEFKGMGFEGMRWVKSLEMFGLVRNVLEMMDLTIVAVHCYCAKSFGVSALNGCEDVEE